MRIVGRLRFEKRKPRKGARKSVGVSAGEEQAEAMKRLEENIPTNVC